MHAMESWIFSFQASGVWWPGRVRGAGRAEALASAARGAAFVAVVAERLQNGRQFVSCGQAFERGPQRSVRFGDPRDGHRNPFRVEGYHGAFQLVPELARKRLNVLTAHATGRIRDAVFGGDRITIADAELARHALEDLPRPIRLSQE